MIFFRTFCSYACSDTFHARWHDMYTYVAIATYYVTIGGQAVSIKSQLTTNLRRVFLKFSLEYKTQHHSVKSEPLCSNYRLKILARPDVILMNQLHLYL